MKGVKVSYTALITALENIHETSHELEALGPSKTPTKWKIIAAIILFLLDYAVLQVAKLSKTFQTEHIDLASLVDSNSHLE